MKKEEKKLLILNILIILLEILGFALTLKLTKSIAIQYYTEDSNLLMLITSIIFTYYLIAKKEIPKWLDILYHMAVLGLTITFLVVLFVLAPMYNFNYVGLLFNGIMLFFHTLCPILAIVTYLFFYKNKITKKHLPYTMLFTIIYSVIIIICNICRVIEGPYPFLMIYKQPIYLSIIWVIVIDGGAYLLSKGVLALKEKLK